MDALRYMVMGIDESDYRRAMLNCSRRSGKTTVAAIKALKSELACWHEAVGDFRPRAGPQLLVANP